MASYIPTPQGRDPWQTPAAKSPVATGLHYPAVRSGSQRDYGGHFAGHPEFSLPTLSKAAAAIQHNIGNLILYQRLWKQEHAYKEEQAAEEETTEVLHKDITGLREALTAPGSTTATSQIRMKSPAEVAAVSQIKSQSRAQSRGELPQTAESIRHRGIGTLQQNWPTEPARWADIEAGQLRRAPWMEQSAQGPLETPEQRAQFRTRLQQRGH